MPVTNFAEMVEIDKQKSLALLKDIEAELKATTEFSNPSMNYMSAIRYTIAEGLEKILKDLVDINRQERVWTTASFNPANKARA